MKKLLTGALTMLVLISIAAPAWADVAYGPFGSAGGLLISLVGLGCLGFLVLAALVIGIIFIIKHNNKKKSGDQ
ncbi:MAG: hypothetical protein FWD65_06390 [Coriobacteriia bacterium]|nr:hypothetical protein [Coriobacteriia bacterium]